MLLWQAECRDCTLSHWTPLTTAHLIHVFDNSIDRDEWRREHMVSTGHWVGTRVHNYDPDESSTGCG